MTAPAEPQLGVLGLSAVSAHRVLTVLSLVVNVLSHEHGMARTQVMHGRSCKCYVQLSFKMQLCCSGDTQIQMFET